MKTLYLTVNGGKIGIDNEGKPFPIYGKVESIRNIYLITEPTKIVYGDVDGNVEEIYADVDDLVIVFYRDDFKHHIVIANSAQWVENIKDYDEKEQKRKEEWAAKHTEDGVPCCDCDNCSNLKSC
jgi:hypothetical protein